MSPTLPTIRIRLSVMMFLEFFLWASWYVPIGGYMNSTLGFTGGEIGLIYTTVALGAIISPLFVGFVADRYFATERVLGVLHLVGAVCLFLSSGQGAFWVLMIFLTVNALAFMPTLALANSLAFRNIDDREKFSWIAVFGTIGWIVSGLLVDFVLGGAEKRWFFFLAGGGAVAMGLYCFTLPHTPPKGAEESGGDVLGLRALQLLKEPSFLVFAASVLLICIPLTFFFTWMNAFLVETNRPKPTALMTLSQCSEIIVMIVMPWFIARIGLKYVLVIGMTAWVLRYLLFATLSLPLIIVGLLLHGFCYCFVFVAAFIYADKRAPKGMSASAQSFIAFLMWGVGMLVGANLAGLTGGQYAPQTIAATKVNEETGAREEVEDAPLPEWPVLNKFEEPKAVSLSAILGGEGEQVALIEASEPALILNHLEILGTLPEGSLVRVKTEEKEGVKKVVETDIYARSDVLAAARKADTNGNGVVSKAEWTAASTHDWPPIWLWPAALAAVVALMFLVGGRDAEAAEEPGKPGLPTPEAGPDAEAAQMAWDVEERLEETTHPEEGPGDEERPPGEG